MELDPRQYENFAVSDNDTHNIVLSYLVHSCFKETVESYLSCTGISQPADCLEDIDRRKGIIGFVLNGNVLKAIEQTEQLAPGLLQQNDDLRFDLLGLHFVELVRSRPSEDAVDFAKKQLRPFGETTAQQKYMGKIEDHMALLAYNEPEKSPMFHLLSLDYRQDIADKLNRAILDTGRVSFIRSVAIGRELLRDRSSGDGVVEHTNTSYGHANKPSYSSLERLIQQTTVVRQLLNQESSKDGLPPFSLKDFIKR